MIPHIAFQPGRGRAGAPAVPQPAVIAANSWSQPVWALQSGAGVTPRALPAKVPGIDAPAPGMAVTDNSGGGQSWKTVTITGTDRLIAGWDFAGCVVTVRGARATIEDCRFAPPKVWSSSTSSIVNAPYALTLGIGADDVSDAIVRYCDFDGGEGKCNSAIFVAAGGARALISNSRFRFFASDNLKILSTFTSDADRPRVYDCYLDHGGYGAPAAHYDAITVGRGGAHIRRVLFNDTARANAYGLNNDVRCQADAAGYVIDNVLVEDCVAFGRTGPSMPFQNSNDNSAVGSVRYRRLIIAANDAGNILPNGQQDSEGIVEITNILRFADGAAVAIPPLKPGGFTYTPTLATLPSGTVAGVEVGSFSAVDLNGEAITYALQDSAGGRFAISGNKLRTGLIATEYGVAQSHMIVVRISDAGGKYMDRNVTIAVSSPGGLPTITVDQGSLRFPAVNGLASNIALANYSYLSASNPNATAGTWFNNDQCWMASLEVPWEQLDGATASTVFGVLGNLNAVGATSPRTFGLFVGGKRHATLAGKMQIVANSENAASADWFNKTIDISALRHMLVVFRRSGSTFFAEVYAKGALVASVSQAVGGWAASARQGSNLLIGHMGSSAGAALSSGGIAGFPGSIGLIGHYVGAVTQADLEAISAGTHPLTQLTAANWRQYRDLMDASTASLTKPAGATGDASAAFTASGTGFGRGSDLLGRRSGAAWIAADALPDGYVWGLQPGQTTATVRVSGAAAGVTGLVEARVLDESGQVTADWTILTGSAIAGGAWTGTMAAPRNSGWGHIDVRPASNPTLICRLRNKVGVGFKFGVMGQSQLSIALNAADMAKVPAANTALSYQTFDQTILAPVLKRSTQGRPVTDFAAVAADLIRTYTTAPVCIIDMAVAGTGIDQLLDDSENARRWSDIPAMLAMCGSDISAVIINWSTNNQSTLAMLEGYLDPLIRGDAPVGATPAYTVNHFLRDGLTFPATMAIALSPPTRHTDTSKTAVTDFTGGPYTSQAGAARADYYAYPAAHPGVIAAIGPSIDDMAITSNGGPHPPTNVDEGPSRVARRLVVGLLRAMGTDTTTDPAIQSGALTSGSTAIDVNVSRPNGGSIQTAWAIKGVAVPAGYTTVQGFEVQSGGTGNWSRSGFTAEIVNAAGGVVRLTKSSGTWPAGTKIRYLANGPLDYGLPTEADKPYHGMLYESGPLEGGLGLPVRGLWTAAL